VTFYVTVPAPAIITIAITIITATNVIVIAIATTIKAPHGNKCSLQESKIALPEALKVQEHSTVLCRKGWAMAH
jgi:hypothetical protein